MRDFGPISLTFLMIAGVLVGLLLLGLWTSVMVVSVFLVGWTLGVIVALVERDGL